jgi:hypothetical protein
MRAGRDGPDDNSTGQPERASRSLHRVGSVTRQPAPPGGPEALGRAPGAAEAGRPLEQTFAQGKLAPAGDWTVRAQAQWPNAVAGSGGATVNFVVK